MVEVVPRVLALFVAVEACQIASQTGQQLTKFSASGLLKVTLCQEALDLDWLLDFSVVRTLAVDAKIVVKVLFGRQLAPAFLL